MEILWLLIEVGSPNLPQTDTLLQQEDLYAPLRCVVASVEWQGAKALGFKIPHMLGDTAKRGQSKGDVHVPAADEVKHVNNFICSNQLKFLYIEYQVREDGVGIKAWVKG